MKVLVRKNNVAKAVTVLSRGVTADGDLKRYIERANGYMSKGQLKRKAKSAAKMRYRRELNDRMEEDSNGH